jgi:hypothetical protein
MKRWVSLVMLMGAVLAGCGDTGVAPAEENLASTAQELVTCSTFCEYTGSTISCTGNTCSAKTGDYVVCDGVGTYCPVDPGCSGSMCEGKHGTYCSPNGSEAPCCNSDGSQGGCFCSKNKWICTL